MDCSPQEELEMEEEKKKVYTFSQVSQHNNPKDCWLIINAKVYDVTNFLEEHPGGDEILLTATGKDATDEFEGVGHSTSAKATMAEYCIGEVDMSTIPAVIVKFKEEKRKKKNGNGNGNGNGNDNNVESSELTIKILQFVVPLAVLALAFGIRLVYS